MKEEEISAEELSECLVPAIDQQICSDETPFVKEQYDRLLAEGESAHEAKLMMALCLADEIEALQTEKRKFNLLRYRQMLQFLPTLPE